MRILGHIPHSVLKITVFQLNMKLAVKLEMGLWEQTFKIRESDTISGLDDIVRLVDEEFIDQCLERFHGMSNDINSAFTRHASV